MPFNPALVVTAAQREAARKEAWRQTAWLSKADFAQALMTAGIITEAEAIGWAARGEIPAAGAAAIEGLPEEMRASARLRAASAPHIARTHPIVGLLAAAYQLSDEQVDGLFEGS